MKDLSLVVLAAGLGTRFLPLTQTTPKSLLKVANKETIVYNLENASPFVNEIVIVVSYLGDEIKKRLGSSFRKIPIKYIDHTKLLGTADALLEAQNAISNQDFILIYGDDLYDESLFRVVCESPLAIAGQKNDRWQQFGVLKIEEGLLKEIIEKPKEYVGDLVNIGLYRLNKGIFSYLKTVKSSPRGELELTDLVTSFAKDYKIKVVEAEH